MQGLRVFEESEGHVQPLRQFQGLFALLSGELREYRWALSGTIVLAAAAGGERLPDGAELDALFEQDSRLPHAAEGERPIWERGWIRSEGLRRLSPLVDGDWTQIIGFDPTRMPRRFEVRAEDSMWLCTNADVVLLCIDALAWEFYSQRVDLVRLVRAAFPMSKPRVLGEAAS